MPTPLEVLQHILGQGKQANKYRKQAVVTPEPTSEHEMMRMSVGTDETDRNVPRKLTDRQFKAEQRADFVYDQIMKNPNRVIDAPIGPMDAPTTVRPTLDPVKNGHTNLGRINKLATPLTKLPGALGMLDAAATAAALREWNNGGFRRFMNPQEDNTL